jgi:hypothetical protein
MAGEINLKHTATGATIKALILDANRTQRWNGSAMVAISSVADADWATGLVACTEQQTSDATDTAVYVGNWPAITTAGDYTILFFSGASPAPGDRAVGVQDYPVGIGAALTQQNIRDAMKLARTAGTPPAGSVDKDLEDIVTKTDQLAFTDGDVKATLDGETVTLDSDYDAAKTAAAAGAAMSLTAAERNSIADAFLNRGTSNIEDTADKHSVGAMVMIATNSSISGTTLTAKKPSDDSTFQTYTITVSADADPITGVS